MIEVLMFSPCSSKEELEYLLRYPISTMDTTVLIHEALWSLLKV